jgi:hypothetical protein
MKSLAYCFRIVDALVALTYLPSTLLLTVFSLITKSMALCCSSAARLVKVVVRSPMWVVQQLCHIFTTTTKDGKTGSQGRASNRFANNKSKAVKNHQPQPSCTSADSTTSKPVDKVEPTPAPSGAGDVDTAHRADRCEKTGDSRRKMHEGRYRRYGDRSGPRDNSAHPGHDQQAEPATPGKALVYNIIAVEVQVEVGMKGGRRGPYKCHWCPMYWRS